MITELDAIIDFLSKNNLYCRLYEPPYFFGKLYYDWHWGDAIARRHFVRVNILNEKSDGFVKELAYYINYVTYDTDYENTNDRLVVIDRQLSNTGFKKQLSDN